MKSPLHCGGSGSRFVHILLVLAVLAFTASPLLAQDDTAAAETIEPPPLPLHQFEGNGGAFVTTQAYLVNPAVDSDDVFGLPAFGYISVAMGNGRFLQALTATETLWGKLELGFAWNGFTTGDLNEDVLEATDGAVQIRSNRVDLFHVNARFQFVGDPGPEEWWPALTVGVHYKYNSTVEDIDEDLGGGLTAIGIDDNQGFDFTLVATKYYAPDWLPVPVCASIGLRLTRAAHVGLLGFTEDYTLQGEFSVCSPIAEDVWIAAEYKMKPDEYETVPGLIEYEQDWWTIDVAYLANSHLTVSVGYGHFGWILNHKANASFGIAVKYEF